MNGWLLIWVLFVAGFFPLGYGIYILRSPQRRAEQGQKKAGMILLVIGIIMILPVLWVWIPLALHTHRIR